MSLKAITDENFQMMARAMSAGTYLRREIGVFGSIRGTEGPLF
jgi:hypothetical protein